MLGFAIVDRPESSRATAVWLTTRVEAARVGHTNAVVIHDDDEDRDRKVRALTADRVVVLTPDTQPPVPFQHALSVETFGEMVDQTDALQRRIEQAIADYSARSRKKHLVQPDFAAPPMRPRTDHEDPAQRALAVANYVAQAWMGWLATEEQRARRAVDSRSGARPWMMPEELSNPEMAVFPAEFGRHVQPEPLS